MKIKIKQIIIMMSLLLSFNYLTAQIKPNGVSQTQAKTGVLQKRWKTRKVVQSTNDSYSEYKLPDSLGLKNVYGFASFEDTSDASKQMISLKPISIELYDNISHKMIKQITFSHGKNGDYEKRVTGKYLKLLRWLWARELRYKKISLQTQIKARKNMKQNSKGVHIIAFKTNP